MDKEQLFREIRPYRDHEIPAVIDALLKHPISDQIISSNFPTMPVEKIKEAVRNIRSIDAFQKEIILFAILNMLEKSSEGISYSGVENLGDGDCFTFISNHRDITLDPVLLNYVLAENNFSTVEVAIGDNLLQNEWVEEFVRVNKSFIVRRDLPPRELVRASKTLSDYIYYTVVERAQSVWIAQREGRAKDGNDKTHPGVLNMLAMASEGDIQNHFQSYNIVPVAISYEHDPCDVDKVWSLYSQKYLGGYVKSEMEDQLAMQKGIEGRKGHIHFHFSKPLSEEIAGLGHLKHKNEIIHAICEMIDREVLLNYRSWSTNFIAFDLLNNTESWKDEYNDDQKDDFIETIETKISKLDGDKQILRRMLYQKYANPIINRKTMLDRLSEQAKSRYL
jgi:hypothetical protein